MTVLQRCAVLAAGAVMGTVLVGCGGDDKPAVCSDIEGLRESVQSLQDVSLERGALTKVQQDVDEIRSRLTTFKASAKDEFSDDVTEVQTAIDSLSTTVGTAKDSPSGTTLAAVGTATASVADALKGLRAAVKDAC
jgi:hypothetical protein